MRIAPLLLAAVAFVACGGTDSTSEESGDLVSGCDGDGYVGGIQPDEPVDYLGLRYETRGPSGASTSTLHETGMLCATASDVAACRAKVESHRELGEQCDYEECNASYYVYTRGDDVGFASSRADVVALVGRVDTPAEAFMMATWKRQYQGGCLQGFAPPRYAARADGWDVEMNRAECTDVEGEKLTYRALVHVSTSGEVTERSRVLVDRKTGGPECVPTPASP